MTIDYLARRKSVRSFKDRPLSEQEIKTLNAEITMATTIEPCIRFQLITNDSNPFESFFKSYGLFKNAKNYVACVVDMSYPNAMVKAGYYAEQIALQVVKMGLGSCFVGGSFDSSKVKAQMRVSWKLPFLLLVGEPSESKQSTTGKLISKLTHRKNKDIKDFLDGDEHYKENLLTEYPWLLTGLQAIACAPSAMNKKPVKIKIYKDNNESKIEAYAPDNALVDLGAALWNWQAVVPGFWDIGNPAFFYPDSEDL